MPELGLPAPPWIVGHRGVRGPVPENTVASLLEAVAQGADMVEADLQLTADGQLVVHHDMVVRISAEEKRSIGLSTLEEIRRGRAAGGGEASPPDGGIPTLAELLAASPPELPLNLEIKRYDRSVEPGPLIEALARELAGRRRLLVSSFDWPVLGRLRERLPELLLAPLGGRLASWEDLLEAARRLGAFSIHLHRRLAADLGRQGRLEESRAAGRAILAYTVNDAEEARELLGWGVAGFFTDGPAALRRQLGQDR